MRAAVAIGAGSAVSAVVAAPAAADTAALTAAQRRVVLDLAALVSTTPVRLPLFGETIPEQGRVTEARLSAALRRVGAGRSRLLKAGVRLLVDHGVDPAGADPAAAVGGVLARGGKPAVPPLRAVVAVALATASDHFAPDADAPAELWLAFARRYNERITARG